MYHQHTFIAPLPDCVVLGVHSTSHTNRVLAEFTEILEDKLIPAVSLVPKTAGVEGLGLATRLPAAVKVHSNLHAYWSAFPVS